MAPKDTPSIVKLEPPSLRRRIEFVAAVERSRALHRPWVYPPATDERYRAYLHRCTEASFRGFLVVLAATGDLAGVINVSEIVRGNFRSAFLGYYAFCPHAGHGLMTEGLRLAVERAFGRIGLHRLEANVQPGNLASIRLVTKLGFRREGFSPRYLKVGGRWRDHERWALLAENWKRSGRR